MNTFAGRENLSRQLLITKSNWTSWSPTMKVECCHLVSANLSLLRETLVAKGSCCCCVEMHEICKFNPVPGPPLINWLVVLVGPQPPSGVCDISKSGLDMEVMGKGAAKHSCLPNVWKWWDEKSLEEGGGGKEG